MPCCCVIIVNYNSWEVLRRCLDHLGKQTWRNFQVVVIDNASTHPPPEDFATRYPWISLVQSSINLGFAGGNNRALRALTSCEWIALLNPDAFPEPDWLEQLVETAQAHPDYTMFGSRQVIAGVPHLLDGEGDVYHISGLVWRSGHGRPVSEGAREPREIFSPCAAAALYRADAFLRVGGFDEDFFCYVEDVDLGFRLRLLGYKALLVPSSVVHHVGSATTGGGQSDFALYHGHRNLIWTYVKNMPGVLFWSCLPLHLLLNLVTLAIFAWRGKGPTVFRAKRDALRGFPKMWEKRRLIQRDRVVSTRHIWRALYKGWGRQ
ncbi:glycosyltransferase family 2 protein [Desulfuromonas acetexigens]|uniref:Glycosyltransferase family 2 protein n=1 Tax=Trichloromonas acetexigens TaxID=38815 RepID=A0A550JHM3_9BACT|nr:glycosyltransferase family 2 protein [Desulfuromonas acetexigens]